MKKISSSNNILTTSPIVKNDEVFAIYVDKLEEILKNENCKNIAILGNYGSGKSSVIETFFEKNNKLKSSSITITIGSYITDLPEKNKKGTKQNQEQDLDKPVENNQIYDELQCPDETEDGKISTSEQILVNKVEESILKQVIYRDKYSKFPKSTLVRFDKECLLKKLAYTFIILYTIWFIINFYYKTVLKKRITFLKVSSIFGIYGILILIIAVFLVYKMIHFLVNKIKFSKIKIKDYEIALTEEKNSVFSRYLTEIIYYFQITKTKLVVFEDLDRFSKDVALKVIQELKELNTILNNAYGIDKIVFIYAVRDDLLNNMEDKNKFFDYSLSILPISTPFNSMINLDGLLRNSGHDKDISQDIIETVSFHIYDMRTLINIVNDYALFKNILPVKELDKLFAMVVFKNYYFKEYQKLWTANNILKRTFEYIENKREDLKTALEESRTKIDKSITSFEADVIKSKKELKHLLVGYSEHQLGNDYKIKEFEIDGQKRPILEFFEEEFDMTTIEKSELSFLGYGLEIFEKDIFNAFGSKKEFISRYNLLGNQKRKDELKNERSLYNKQIEQIERMTANEILKNYEEEIKKNQEDNLDKSLLYDLIKNNYITKEYMEYVTSPVTFKTKNGKEEEFKYTDYEFVINVLHKRFSMDAKLTGVKTIICRISNQLDSQYSLNYDLLHFLIDNEEESEIKDYTNKFMNQFNIPNDIQIKFLVEYFDKHKNHREKILNRFKDNKIDFWESYMNHKDDLDIEIGIQLLTCILEHKDYIAIIKNPEEIKIFFENELCKVIYKKNNLEKESNAEIEKINNLLQKEIVRNNLQLLRPRLHDITMLTQENFSYIYENNFYTFDYVNIFKITEYSHIQIPSLQKRFPALYQYIKKNIDLFCKEYYIHCLARLKEEKVIKEALFHKDIDIKIKIIICKIEKFKLNNIDNVDKNLYSYITTYDHLKATWKNVFSLFSRIEDKNLFDYTIKNLPKLKEDELTKIKEEEKEKFFSALVEYEIKKDIITTEEILKLYSPKYSNTSRFTDNEIKLLIKYHCIVFNKRNYKKAISKLSSNEKYHYILDCFRLEESITNFRNIINIEDAEILLYKNDLNNDEKIELIYSLYKKEKPIDLNLALNNFVERLRKAFIINKTYKLKTNETIYREVFVKIRREEIFKTFEKNDIKIEFSINSLK